MSETTAPTTRAGSSGASTADGALGSEIGTPGLQDEPRDPRRNLKRGLLLLVLVVALLVPIYLDSFWTGLGFAVAGAAIGAIGLNLLVGTTGQLSLAHAFFLAVGAATYVFVSGEPGGSANAYGGLQLPPVVGMVAGVLLAGLAGLLFSPIAARLRGIYLGVASLGLVFIGVHLMNTLTYVTGGFNGRVTPLFALPGFEFSNRNPQLFVAGVPYGESEREWYLGLALLVAAWWFAHNLLRSRPGRALQTLRDSETAAAVMGVNVQAYKARIFFISSMYAGLAGVVFALSTGAIAPEVFGLEVSVLYLAMIVLGGLGSVGGAVAGAAFVTALPILFQRYADALPLLAQSGEPGIGPGQAARILFGLAVIFVVLFEPAGLAGLTRRFRRTGKPRGSAAAPAQATS